MILLLTPGNAVLSRNGLNETKIWFSANKLKLNISKTQQITFTSDKKCAKSYPVKLLVITLDVKLNWSARTNYLRPRLAT